MKKTEDEVRDLAKKILGFESLVSSNAVYGVGQLTTFNSLDSSLMAGICHEILMMLL